MGSSDVTVKLEANVCPHACTSRPRASERGFTLAAVIVLLTIMAVTIAFTVPPQWSKIMERERDRQTVYVMKQTARAIYEFRRKNNAFPTSLEQLQKARQPRFIRGTEEFPVDPGTGKNDWLILPAGQQQQQAAATGGIGVMGPTPAPGTSTAPPGTAIQGVPAKDFVGPIGGIRPSRTGKSFLALNGKETYEEWTYTVSDLEIELQQRQASLSMPQ